jgi:riboflavin kinase / FMN adenylyltransferase
MIETIAVSLVVSGEVIHGQRLGRQLGFPTANLRPEGVPATLRHGIYAGRALGHLAAVSYGVRPTVGQDLEPLIEVHILDFEDDLYGRRLTVELELFLRPELDLPSLEALRGQIEEDVAEVRRLLGGASKGEPCPSPS